MPTKKKPQIDAWSFSRFSDYKNCPLKAKFKHVDKLKEPSNKAMERGSNIHDKAEKCATGQTKGIPKELQLFKGEFMGLRRRKKELETELRIALDKDWKVTDWFDSDAWLRCVVDCMYDEDKYRYIIDHKTGKIRTEQMEQLDLYAIAGFLTAPDDIKILVASFWYLDQGEERNRVYRRDDLPRLQKEWVKKTKKMLSDRTFKPTPNRLCSWCYFRKENDGPCQY